MGIAHFLVKESSGEDEELRLLKKKMADLEEKNAILKKAIRIFTKPEK